MWGTAPSLAVWWADGATGQLWPFSVSSVGTDTSWGESASLEPPPALVSGFLAWSLLFLEQIHIHLVKTFIWKFWFGQLMINYLGFSFSSHLFISPSINRSCGRLIPAPTPRPIHIESVVKQKEQLVKKNTVVLAYLWGIGSTPPKDSKIHECSSLI